MNVSKFIERLSELIFETGLNTTQINSELGCGNATINHYLTGRYLPTVKMTVKLSNYFKCSIDFLLGRTDVNYYVGERECPPFGQRLIELCEYFKISRYKLQKKTEISESIMRYWVRGKTEPSLPNVVKIAEALECSVDFVLGREI